MNIQFGAVKLIIQTRTDAPIHEYNKKVEVIRDRIYGNLRPMGPDSEAVRQAIQSEAGPYPDGRALYNATQAKFRKFLDEQEQAHANDADYRAILLDTNTEDNPLSPGDEVTQKLFIDGADVKDFLREVTDRAFFRKPLNPLTPGAPRRTSFDDGRDTASKFSSAIKYMQWDYLETIREEVAAGKTDNVIDLDA